MSIKSGFYDLVVADSPMTTLMTGGIYLGQEIKRSDPVTAAAFDANGEIQPCLLIKQATEISDGPADTAGRAFIDLYLYQFSGFDVIDQGKERLYAVLHKQRISAERVWEVTWLNDITDQEDPALECSMHLCRYQAVRYRG